MKKHQTQPQEVLDLAKSLTLQVYGEDCAAWNENHPDYNTSYFSGIRGSYIRTARKKLGYISTKQEAK